MNHYKVKEKTDFIAGIHELVNLLNAGYRPLSTWQTGKAKEILVDSWGDKIQIGNIYFYRNMERNYFYKLSLSSMIRYLHMTLDDADEIYKNLVRLEKKRVAKNFNAIQKVVNRQM